MRTIVALSLVSLVGVVVACGGGDEPVSPQPDGEEPTGGDDGGVVVPGEDGGEPIPPPPPVTPNCEPSKLPSEDECVIHENFGVFVSPQGNDETGNGSRNAPFRTLGHAIDTAHQSRRRVYACAGTYAEALELKNDVSVFGNLTCDTPLWGQGLQRARVEAPTSPAARAVGIAGATRVEGVELVAPAATSPGGSSIGLYVEDSPGLLWTDGAITAGDAAAGVAAVAPAGYTLQGGAGGGGALSGECISCTPYDDPQCDGTVEYRCPAAKDGTAGQGQCVGASLPTLAANPGGAGGRPVPARRTASGWARVQHVLTGDYVAPGNGGAQPGNAQTAAGAYAFYRNEAGGIPESTRVATQGDAGTRGEDGANGAQLGAFGVDGYTPADGTAGTNGGLGQGGGGGRAMMTSGRPNPNWTAASGPGGAGGGAGGCPGIAASAATGGGASVAVLAFGPAFRLEATKLVAGKGGSGGRGHVGAAPTAGGAAGIGIGDTNATNGKSGGAGGAAGYSGHGGAGPSVGIAWTGSQPTQLAGTTIEVAEPAAGQPEVSGNGKTIAATPAGLAQDVLAF